MFYLHRHLYQSILAASTDCTGICEVFCGQCRGPLDERLRRRRCIAPEQPLETRNVCNPFNHRPALGKEETRRIFSAAERLLRRDRGLFLPPQRHSKPSRARRPRTAGHRSRAFPERSGGPRFHHSFRPSEDVMMASSAAMDPRADGRLRASTAEAAAWS
jgi:hypothetical protein